MSEEKFTGYASHGHGKPLEKWSYVPRPLGADDVEVAISHCGICHSDIHTLDSGWGPTTYPVIVGHEIVGKVTAVGPNVKKLKVGDRAAVGAQVWSCQQCKDCHNGHEPHCPSMVFTYNAKYQDGQTAYGGYADRVRVDSSYTFKVPDGLDSAEAAPLLCAGVTVFAPIHRLGVKKGTRVGVVGIGGLGHYAIQFAAKLGAEVTAISSGDRKKDDAAKLGAHKYINFSDKAQVSAASRSLDVLLSTVSSATDLDSYISLLDTNGDFVLLGAPENPISFYPFSIIGKRIRFSGSLIGSPKEIELTLEFAVKHNIKSWIEIKPIDQVNEAIESVRQGKPRFRIVLQTGQN